VAWLEPPVFVGFAGDILSPLTARSSLFAIFYRTLLCSDMTSEEYEGMIGVVSRFRSYGQYSMFHNELLSLPFSKTLSRRFFMLKYDVNNLR
jgi:hypothetical protein